VDNVTFHPTMRVLGECYTRLTGPLVGPLIAALVLLVLLRAEHGPGDSADGAGLFPHELALAAGFALIPLYAYLIAKFVSHIFMPRYGLPAVIGCSILFAWFSHGSADWRRAEGWVLAALFSAWFFSGFAFWMRDASHSTAAGAANPSLV